MADKKVTYEIGVDSSKGVSGIKQFSSTVKKELKSIEGDFDDTATAGERVATVLSRMAGELDTELDRAAQAADALAAALGPELAARADVGSIVGDLQKMGLTFEDIVADADKLATSLKQLDGVQMSGIDRGLGGVSTKLGDIPPSVNKSKSVLANMVGNATQDLGVLAGVAGSAGVAIGQIGEYAADALGEGEKLGSALGSMAKVAGPIAAIALATQALSEIMGGIKAEEAFNAELVDKFTKAIEEGQSAAVALHEQIRETGEFAYQTGAFGGGGFLGLGSSSRDLVPILEELGYNLEQIFQLVNRPTQAAAFVEQLREKAEELMETTPDLYDEYVQLADGLDAYVTSEAEATEKQAKLNELLTVTEEIARSATTAFLDAEDPMRKYADEIDRIAYSLLYGAIPAASDLEAVSEGMGIDIADVLGMARERADELTVAADEAAAAVARAADATKEHQLKIEQAIKDAHAAALESQRAHAEAMKEARAAAIEAQREQAEAAREQFIALAETEVKLNDIVGVFEQIGARGDALRSIFDLTNAPLDAEGQVRDVALAIDDLSEVAKDVDLSEGLDPSNVNADALLDAIDSLRPEIQARVVEAFSAGGPEAATAMAQDYIAQVADELNISEIEAAKLLGMEDIQALVTVAIEQTSLTNAQSQLDVLTGLGGETPLTASIALALDAGTITGRQAQLLTQPELEALGVDIPAELAITPKPGEMRKAREALQTEADANPTKQPVEPKGLVEAAAIITAGPAGGWPAIKVPVVPVFPSGYSAGGSTPSGGPLMAGPTAMSLATTGPTATATSAVPMTLALPAAPTSSRTVVINQVIQAAVIGSYFDVMNAVEDANRGIARLLPRQP